MIVTGYSFADLRQRAEPVLAAWTEELRPSAVELLPHNPYAPSYAWMYAYEKRVKYWIEEVLGTTITPPVERALFGADGAFSEPLSNAFVHGHRRNPDLVIKVCCALGHPGLAFSITDQGPGFAVAQVLATAARGGGYYRYAGNGLRTLSERDQILASYADNGRTLAAFVVLEPISLEP